MPRDYKKRPAARNKRLPAHSKTASILPCWACFLLGVALSAAVLVVVSMMQPQWLPGGSGLLDKSQQTPTRDQPIAQQAQGPDYSFYTVLPEMEVAVPLETLKPSARVATQANELYQLQLVTYTKSTDAEKMKASLALNGISARVEKVTINDKTFYRVRSGPYVREQAYGLHQRLLEYGVESIILKVKKNPR